MGKVTSTRLLIIEPRPIVCLGLVALFKEQADWKVCATAQTLEQAHRAIQQHRPHCLLVGLEVGCDDLPSNELIHRLRDMAPRLPILVVGPFDESTHAAHMLHAGANGYIMGDTSPEQIVLACRAVMEESVYVSPHVAKQLLRNHINRHGPNGGDGRLNRLSEREMEVFELIARGKTVRDIAATLSRSVKTIEAHREHIKHKLAVQTTDQLKELASSWVGISS